VIGRLALSPLDLERRFGLIGGDIFHGKMGLDSSSRTGHVRRSRLQDAAQGTLSLRRGRASGRGVTGAPGHNAARAVLADRRKLSI